MKTVKRNSSLTFPIKLNYKVNDLICSYRGGKSTTNLKVINVNKNKFFGDKKSFISCDKNIKNESFLNSNNLKNKNNKNDKIFPFINQNNNNINYLSFIENYSYNNHKYLRNNYKNYNFNFFSYINKTKDSNNSSNYLKDRSYISNNTMENINLNNNINNSIYSYYNENNNKNLFNKKHIYQKPKNEKRQLSCSFAITDSNSVKENLSSKSNINNIETNYKNYLYSNFNRSKKTHNILLGRRYTEFTGSTTSTENNINNYFYNNNLSFLMNERKTNIDYSNLNLYYPKDAKDYNDRKSRINYIKYKPKINNDANNTISCCTDKNYKTSNDNNSYIYVRKNSSKKKKINNINLNFAKSNANKIKVNLKLNNIFENAYYVQKNVILIQKNYRMHLACLKKYILKAIRDIIEGSNKLNYLLYKKNFKKLIYILNNAYIKSIDIDMKTAKIIPKKKNKNILNEKSKYNNINKPKYCCNTNNQEITKNVSIKGNKNYKNFYSSKPKILLKPKLKTQNLNKIKKDIALVRNLKTQIMNKLERFRK